MPRSLLAVLLAAALAGLAATQWGRLRGLRDTAVSGEVHVMAVDFEVRQAEQAETCAWTGCCRIGTCLPLWLSLCLAPPSLACRDRLMRLYAGR